jgi:hypothetical protein
MTAIGHVKPADPLCAHGGRSAVSLSFPKADAVMNNLAKVALFSQRGLRHSLEIVKPST